MNADDVLREVQESYSEWLEMTENPAALVAGILANRVIVLMDKVQYLEKRLNHDSCNTNSGHRARHPRVATASKNEDNGYGCRCNYERLALEE